MSQRPTTRIPRWIQLVGLPVLLLSGWALAGTLGHATDLFLTASVIAFLLNPLVGSLQGLRIRRGVGVAVVFLTLAAAMIVVIVALVTVVVEQTRSAADRVDAYLTDEPGRSGDSAFDRDVADLESWLHSLSSSGCSREPSSRGSPESSSRSPCSRPAERSGSSLPSG